MVDARAGILRAVTPPEPAQLERLQGSARRLGVAWPDGASWSGDVRDLDRSDPDAAAFLPQAAHLVDRRRIRSRFDGGIRHPGPLVRL